ncbi:MAG: hypothetical protein ACYTFV_03400 [Planctomycetota bacterium]
MTSTVWWRWPLRGALAALGVAGGVVAGEHALRAIDPFGGSYYRDTHRYLLESIRIVPDAARPDGRLFENAPGRTLEAHTSTFATDGAGLRAARADEAAPVLPRGAAADTGLRVLFVGDSVTLGWGVDHEQTWVAALEQLATAPDGRAVEALNAGHLQYTTVQEVDWFVANGVRLEPDLVVLVPVVNDLEDNFALFSSMMAAEQERAGRKATMGERLDAWYATNLYGFRCTLAYLRVTGELTEPDPEQGLAIEDRAEYRAGWPQASAALDRMRLACSERGIDMVVFDHTMPRLPGYRDWCEEQGVPWFDFTFTDEESAQPIRNSAADAHANALGHRFLAGKALVALESTGHLVPRD